jgi:cell cycle sensor histidine kinase DivJ
MRSLVALVKGREGPEAAPRSGRPEALRRATLATNSLFVAIASGLGLPFAIYTLLHGMLLPVVLAMVGLATGISTLALHRGGRYEQAAAGQLYGILLAGLLLAIADPGIADFGLAIALIGPIHAALVGDRLLKARSWVLLVLVVGAAVASAAGIILWPEAYVPSYRIVGGLAFAVVAIVVAHTANRLNAAFEVYDRAQINAFKHLIEHLQDAVLRFSSEGDLLFSSRSVEKLLGCRRYELSGGGLLERIHVLDRPAYLTAFSDANRGTVARTLEVRMRRDDPAAAARVPQFIWVEIALSPVIDGEPPEARHEVVALLRDVTVRRDQENEMRLARRAAEDASEAKSRFLATIGHELRTPLNAIVGFSEMMTGSIGGELSPTHREYAELIHKSGNHLIDVVKMLLDMSRIEAGKFELSAEAFTPEALVEPCLHMIDSLAREKRVKFVSNLSKHLPTIVADERACRQILINLLSNAIKFSHEGGVITVGMKRQGASLNISVTDNGIGMSQEAIHRIGEPFFQAQDGLSRRYEGTGLGLSIVKGLVDLHHGTMHAISEAGRGTTMTVLLPINGPAIKIPDTGSVTPLRREAVPQTEAAWPEQKRSAK